jgi:Na+/H+-translocating membrane pyrophosphatase
VKAADYAVVRRAATAIVTEVMERARQDPGIAKGRLREERKRGYEEGRDEARSGGPPSG